MAPGTGASATNSNLTSPTTNASSPVAEAISTAAPPAATAQQKRSREETEATTRAVRRKFTAIPQMMGPPVKVVVGDGESRQAFFIHKSLLSKHSDFFKAALDSNWKEGNEYTVRLPEDDPEHFQLFAAFLYSGQIYSSKDGDHKAARLEGDSEFKRILQSWILGEKLLSVEFKDACTDAFIAKMLEDGTYSNGTIIYPHGAAQCGMKRLCVDVAVWKWNAKAIDKARKKDIDPEFWVGLAAALHKTKLSGLKGRAPFMEQSTCGYHDHDEGSPCYKTMF